MPTTIMTRQEVLDEPIATLELYGLALATITLLERRGWYQIRDLQKRTPNELAELRGLTRENGVVAIANALKWFLACAQDGRHARLMAKIDAQRNALLAQLRSLRGVDVCTD